LIIDLCIKFFKLKLKNGYRCGARPSTRPMLGDDPRAAQIQPKPEL
jgi:hypothetical protein